jgi:hypothetical protein
VVVVAVAVPLSEIVTPEAIAPLTAPEMVYVNLVATKFCPVTFAPSTVGLRFVGANV